MEWCVRKQIYLGKNIKKVVVLMKYQLIVIDDEALVLEQFNKFKIWNELNFELAGCFDNVEEAIDFLYCNHVDLAICDIKMPEFDGIFFAKYCAEHFENLSVIFLSAFADFNHATSALKYGVKDYILKPITTEKLKESLTSVSNEIEKRRKSKHFEKLEAIALKNLFYSITDTNITDENLFLLLQKNSFDTVNTPCMVFNIELCDTERYISEVWKYGTERFYNAISFICNQSTENFVVCSIRRDSNTFLCLYISKNGNTNEFNSCIDTITSTLGTFVNLNVTATINACFSSINQLCESRHELFGNNIANTKDQPLLDRINKYIEDNYSNPNLNRDIVASEVGLNKTYFSVFFKQKTGQNFVDKLNATRIEKSKPYVLDKNIKISTIYKKVGYKDSKYFIKMFKKVTGKTPTEFRNGLGI